MIDPIKPITIAIADDHEMIHNGIKLLLRNDEQYQIKHFSFDGEECLEKLKKEPVDLVLSDISMPKMDGILLTKTVKQKYVDTKVLLLTMHSEDEFILQAIEADADGYVLKNTTSAGLKEAINKVTDGGIYYSEEIVEKIMNGNFDSSKTPKIEQIKLSEREKEVVSLICEELTTKEIAKTLFLSPNTIETHRKNILKKTGVRSTVGLVKYAILHQLVAV